MREERRKSSRLQIHARALFHGKDETITGLVHDFSLRAAGILFDRSVGRLGEVIPVIFISPSGSQILVEAEILRSVPRDEKEFVAIEFQIRDQETEKGIFELMDELFCATGIENRYYTRISQRLSGKISQENSEHNVLIENISMGGVAILSPVELKIDHNVNLMILDSQMNDLHFECRIAHQRKDEKEFRVGMSFEKLKKDDQQKLSKFLRKILDTPS